MHIIEAVIVMGQNSRARLLDKRENLHSLAASDKERAKESCAAQLIRLTGREEPLEERCRAQMHIYIRGACCGLCPEANFSGQWTKSARDLIYDEAHAGVISRTFMGLGQHKC